MVARLVTTMLLLLIGGYGSASFAEIPNLEFRAVYSKADIFAGEQATVTFALFGPYDVVEVEVAKFPEFRGFWSENLSLRQGPIGLGPEMGAGRTGVVGSYMITSMTDNDVWNIRPMRILARVRTADGQNVETFLESAVPALKIKKLPPIPAGAVFGGAVGRFNIQTERNQIPFQKDEPITIRFNLVGEGNFNEINQLPIQLPDFIEILSRRSFLSGSANFAAKTFEMSIVAHSDSSFSTTAGTFVSFNPMTKIYEPQTIPPLFFVYLPPTPPTVDKTAWEPPPPFETWSSYKPLRSSLPFQATNLFLASTFFGTAAYWLARRRAKAELSNPKRLQKVARDQAMACLEAGNPFEFLKRSEALLLGSFEDFLPEEVSCLTRQDWLKALCHKLPPRRIEAARILFETHDRLGYSPEKTIALSPEQLRTLFQDALALTP